MSEWIYTKEQEPTTKIDYRRAFKIACDLLNGDVLYGVDTDKIYELMMKKDGVISSSSYEEYILDHLQELDQGQYASEPTTKNDLGVDARCIDRWNIGDKEAEAWSVKGKLQTRHRGVIHNIDLPSATPQLSSELDKNSKKLEPCEDATLKDIFCMGCEYKEPKTGHWKHDRVNVRCSNCGRGYKDAFGRTSAITYNFCPNCGADMREVEE